MKRLAVVMILLVLAAGKDRAEQPVYEYQAKDRGETPVIVYVGGSGWRTEGTILENERYKNTNIIYICCKTGKYNLTSAWRPEDRKDQADSILSIVRECFPKVKSIVILTYSAGGCMAEPLYDQSQEKGMRTICAVMLDSVFRKYPPEGMEAAGVPIMYAISETNIEKHVTGWTRNWLQKTGATAKEYSVTHGALETDPQVQEDMLQFIKEGM